MILEDSTGSTHEYTYTNGGYKPPLNEDGNLTKNADGSYTFIDTDGRTYIFNPDGTLKSVSTPADDRSPASLAYTYGGAPARLMRIEDRTTKATSSSATRYALPIYKGDTNDTNGICDPANAPNTAKQLFGLIQSSFNQAPSGTLCALRTSDGDITNFYYNNVSPDR